MQGAPVTRPTHVLGVDPGVKGALCLLCLADRSVQVFDTPVKDGLVDGVRLSGIVELCKMQTEPDGLRGVVENVCGRPRQMGVFAFGRSTGLVHGVLDAMSVPYETVAPSQWKPAMGLRRLEKESQAENKSHARELAMRLFPKSAEAFKRVRDDGRAEAALISFFFAQKMHWF